MAEKDSSWGHLDSPQGFSTEEFSDYPLLTQYLSSVRFFSRPHFNPQFGNRWVEFENEGGFYSPKTSIDALRQVIDKKKGKYHALLTERNFDEVYLVVYYSKAHFYNTPYFVPDFHF